MQVPKNNHHHLAIEANLRLSWVASSEPPGKAASACLSKQSSKQGTGSGGCA